MEIESILQTHYSTFSGKNKKDLVEIVDDDHMSSMPIINLHSNIYYSKSNMRLKKNRKVSFLPNLIEVGKDLIIYLDLFRNIFYIIHYAYMIRWFKIIFNFFK